MRIHSHKNHRDVSMSYNELRKGRFSEASQVYFVTTVTHRRNQLFNDFSSARIIINTMRHLNDAEYVNSLSWVVMPDHLHWLFQLGDKNSLPVVMKNLKAVSARSINKKLNRQGRVWQRSYYDRGIRCDEDIKQLSRYIVANPLRAGLVENIEEYPHWDADWL